MKNISDKKNKVLTQYNVNNYLGEKEKKIPMPSRNKENSKEEKIPMLDTFFGKK